MKPIRSDHEEISFSASNDADLWMKVKNGDEKALGHFYSKYYDRLFNYGSRFIADSNVAKDAIQEIFIDFWNRRSSLSEIRNSQQFLYKCLRNKITSKLSTFSNKIQTDPNFERFEIELYHKSHYLNEQIDKDIKQRLFDIIKSLPAKEKEAIFLIYFDGLSYTEVASIMSLKIKTVYNLVHLAIARMKNRKDTLYPPLFMLFL